MAELHYYIVSIDVLHVYFFMCPTLCPSMTFRCLMSFFSSIAIWLFWLFAFGFFAWLHKRGTVATLHCFFYAKPPFFSYVFSDFDVFPVWLLRLAFLVFSLANVALNHQKSYNIYYCINYNQMTTCICHTFGGQTIIKWWISNLKAKGLSVGSVKCCIMIHCLKKFTGM